jgi:O-antigen/teichoic acid export membrane protein
MTPQLSSIWTILKFSLPLGIAGILGTITVQMANIIVSSMCTTDEYAIFANGARELPVIGIVTTSIATIVMADMSKRIKENDYDGALALFRKSAVIGGMFLLPIMFFLLVYSREFIVMLFSEKYIGSVLPFCIFLFYLPIRIVLYQSAFMALGKNKEILFRGVIAFALSITLCYVFTKFWGYIGAAIGTVLVSYVWLVPYNLYTLSKDFKCSPFYILPLKKIYKIALCSLIGVIITLPVFLFNFTSFLRLIVATFCFLLMYSIIAYKQIEEFRELLYPIFIKMKGRL